MTRWLFDATRGHDYPAEALVALLNVAADHGLTRVVAHTTEVPVAQGDQLHHPDSHDSNLTDRRRRLRRLGLPE
ncbi:hypothetical protein OOJ91_02680 [Micromonospora lupini]|uniref:hypothetical protein n=1 Tax=Micromonospora lupini TaxID=285679 RepID=UPI00224DF085|nr:hypothetical protein [Micromonospora lupini]MCX5064776.1 hypothetical protein [Micromonospora lupini]